MSVSLFQFNHIYIVETEFDVERILSNANMICPYHLYLTELKHKKEQWIHKSHLTIDTFSFEQLPIWPLTLGL